MEKSYQDIVTDLKRSFPKGTVQFRSDNNRPYVPNQVYTDRVEQATGSQWDREIKELEINPSFRYVKTLVRIVIGPHYRDGYGFSVIDGDPATNPKAIEKAIDDAVNEAMREALDTYEMGWKDLAPYKLKDWGGNPALKHLMDSQPSNLEGSGVASVQSFAKVDHKCVQCGETLTHEEWDLLNLVPNLNLIYCFEHLPAHMKRKIDKKVLDSFEIKWRAG